MMKHVHSGEEKPVRWSVGKTVTRRGAGLGNEVFPWAKAYLGAKALGLITVEPPWRLNGRRYDKELDSTSAGSAKHLALRALPAEVVRWDSISGLGDDYFEAIQALAPTLDTNKPVLLHDSGMRGGYPAIRRARPYLRNRLLSSPDALRVLEEWERPRPGLRVGVHVRDGDFDGAEEIGPGKFNASLPLEWFHAVLDALSRETDFPIEVVLATDTPTDGVFAAASIGETRPVTFGRSSVGDLAALVSCDVIVSSISSFSMLSIFLSDAPYIWYEPQLTAAGNWLSIWGHESLTEGGGATEKRRIEATAASVRRPRGFAMGNDPSWPSYLVEYLETRARFRERFSDLIEYGVVPSQRA
jgi:hypothetical protein